MSDPLSSQRAGRVERWLKSQGITMDTWQRNMIKHYWGGLTDDREYLLGRLNQRAQGNDPGPWERDRMKR